MCNVFIFTLHVGSFPPFENGLYVGLAISDKGKWVAGSCSQTPDNAIEYLRKMKSRICERIGKPEAETELVNDGSRALPFILKAFETMP